jgi:hypothetical protein
LFKSRISQMAVFIAGLSSTTRIEFKVDLSIAR